jgi:hypothetical protein
MAARLLFMLEPTQSPWTETWDSSCRQLLWGRAHNKAIYDCSLSERIPRVVLIFIQRMPSFVLHGNLLVYYV